MDSNCCSEPVSYAAVEEDGTSGLVVEVFDDLDKVCADVVLLHGCPQSCMPNVCSIVPNDHALSSNTRTLQSKAEIGDCSVSNADSAFMIF